MDESRIARAPSRGSGPWKTDWGTWTPRFVAWTIACVIGLWLGTTVHPAAARGQVARPSGGYQASIADVFRWDIMLAGKEPQAKPVRQEAAPARKYKLPEALLCALEQRPEPVPSVFPQRLSGIHPRFYMAPPSKPAGAWRMKLDAQMARLEHEQETPRVALPTMPGLSPSDRKSIQNQVDRACAQVRSLRMEQAVRIPDPAEPFVELTSGWPAPPSSPAMP